MTKWMRWWGALLMAALLTACGGGDNADSAVAPKVKSTMLVYLLASDLLDGRGAERDLKNMLAAASSPDVNVVLQIGGGKTSGQFAGVDMRRTERYRLAPATAASRKGWALEKLPQAQQPDQVAMNRTDTLRDFIAWGAKHYPAEQFSLVLWDHGGGPIGGFGTDHSYGQRDQAGNAVTMSVADISSALRQAGVHFELLGFDACLMSSLEVAAALQPYANYLVASEEVTYGWGWTEVVSALVEQPLAKGNVLGQRIVESYKSFTGPHFAFSAYAVTDLQHIPALVQGLEQVAQTLQQALRAGGVTTWAKIATARHESEDFQTNILSEQPLDLVDVRSFVEELYERQLLAPALAQTLREALARAVVFYDGGENQAYGLMMYFPELTVRNSSMLQGYAALEFSPVFKAFVQEYAAFASSEQVPQLAVGAPTYDAAGGLTATLSSNMADFPAPAAQGYAVLVQGGVAVAMQQVRMQDNQWRMAQPRQWPQLGGQLVSLLREGEDESVRLIPVISSSGPGTLYALEDAQGRMIVRYLVGGSVAAGAALSMLEVRPGQKFSPLVWDVATQTLHDSGEIITAPAGDWEVRMQAVAAEGEIYAAAVDLVGRLEVSPQSASLAAAK